MNSEEQKQQTEEIKKGTLEMKSKSKRQVMYLPDTLVTIKGEPGLWLINGGGSKFVKVQRLLDKTEKVVRFIGRSHKNEKGEFTPLLNFQIQTADHGNKKNFVMLPDIFAAIFLYKGSLIMMTDPVVFDKEPKEKQSMFMEDIIPTYDVFQFKPYHMSKILKWWAEYKNSEYGKKCIELFVEIEEEERLLEESKKAIIESSKEETINQVEGGKN